MSRSTTDALVIAGSFTEIGGTLRGNIARLMPNGTLDPAFATGAGANGTIHSLYETPEGKFWVAGEFTEFDGISRNRIARLTPEGRLDLTFDPGIGFDGPVYTLRPDFVWYNTLLYAGGDFTSYQGIARPRLAALWEGELYQYFKPSPAPNGPVRSITFDTKLPMSNVIVGGGFTNPAPHFTIYSPSGEHLPTANWQPDGPIYALGNLLSNGWLMFAAGEFSKFGNSTRSNLAGIGPPGNVAATPNAGFNGVCRTLAFRFDGGLSATELYVGGDFTALNGNPAARIALFNRSNVSPFNYELDTTFANNAGANDTILAINIKSSTPSADDKLYIAGAFTTVDGLPRSGIARLFGRIGSQPPPAPAKLAVFSLSSTQMQITWDASLHAASYVVERSLDGLTGWTQSYAGANTNLIDSNLAAGTTYFYRVSAGNANGFGAYSSALNAATYPAPWIGAGSLASSQLAIDGSVQSILQSPDGRIYLLGYFNTVLGKPRKRIARLLADLTLDESFDVDGTSINQIVPLPDGRAYVMGGFLNLNGVPRRGIARLSANGSVDLSFNANTTDSSGFNCIAVQSDGKLIVGGSFSAKTKFSSGVFPAMHPAYLVRLNLDGTVDQQFQPSLYISPTDILVQPHGRTVAVMKWYDQVSGYNHLSLAGLRSNGSLDPSFSSQAPDLVAGNARLANLPGNKLLATGDFRSSSNPQGRSYLAVLNDDGTIDTGFEPKPADIPVSVATPHPEGKVLIAGWFKKSGSTPRSQCARLSANGALDLSWDVGAGPLQGNDPGSIASLCWLKDGSVLAGGFFTSFGDSAQPFLAHLRSESASAAPATPSLQFDPHGSTSIALRWTGGEGASNWHVQKSEDGFTWTDVALLPWTSSTLIELNLPPGSRFSYRVRAENPAGASAFSAPIQARAIAPFEAWKEDRSFSLSEPADSDHDHDGIPMLLEYAFGLDPHTPEAGVLPAPEVFENRLTLRYEYLHPELDYIVEASSNLATWSAADVNQGTGLHPTASTQVDPSPKYLRIRVIITE